MKKQKRILYAGLIILLVMTVAITVHLSNKNNTEDTTIDPFPISEDEERYEVEGKQFKVEGSYTSRTYHYYIYDSIGAIVEEGQVERMPPTITNISEDVLKICFHGGTYADLCKYYDIKHNIFSQEFWNPFIEHNGLIVYYDKNKLVIQDIFDKCKFYQEYVRDMSVTAPPDSIEFFDNDQKLRIVYTTRDHMEIISEVFDLNT